MVWTFFPVVVGLETPLRFYVVLLTVLLAAPFDCSPNICLLFLSFSSLPLHFPTSSSCLLLSPSLLRISCLSPGISFCLLPCLLVAAVSAAAG